MVWLFKGIAITCLTGWHIEYRARIKSADLHMLFCLKRQWFEVPEGDVFCILACYICQVSQGQAFLYIEEVTITPGK